MTSEVKWLHRGAKGPFDPRGQMAAKKALEARLPARGNRDNERAADLRGQKRKNQSVKETGRG